MKTNMKNKYKQLVLKSHLEELSPNDDLELLNWVDSSQENKKIAKEIKNALHNSLSIPTDFTPNTQIAWAKVKSTIVDTAPHQPIKVSISNPVDKSLKNQMGVIWKFSYQEDAPKIYSTTTGKSFLELSDGSKVWLNKKTKVSYSSDFNQDTRTIHLEGEAYFEIAKNPKKPFIIIAPNSRTTVLGTAFNLKAYKNEKTVELTVTHGKVSFANNRSQAIVLEKGNKGVIQYGTNELVKLDNNGTNSLSWKDEKLVFENSSFKEVCSDLESYFSITTNTKSNELNNCRFTGSFNKPQLEDVLKVIEVTMNIEHQSSNNTITFSGKGCK
jgi:transmembrane sensor